MIIAIAIVVLVLAVSPCILSGRISQAEEEFEKENQDGTNWNI